MNEIVIHQQSAIRLPQEWEFGAIERLATYAVKSGFVSKLSQPQIVFIILKGYELNISPMQALADIHLVNGKPGLSVQLMISLANRSGMLSHFDIPDADEAFKAGKATVSATRKDRPDSPITMTFTIDDAKKAGLWDKVGPWTQYPGQMLVNRAVSMLLRRIIPEALSGMYLAEELENTDHSEPSITISEAMRQLPAPVPANSDGRPMYWNDLIKKIGKRIPDDEDYRRMAAKAAELFRKGIVTSDMTADEAEDIIVQNCFTSDELLDNNARIAADKEAS